MSVVVFLMVAIGPRLLSYRTITELSGSMAPSIRTGDLLVDMAQPVESVRAGQVLSFRAPMPGRPVVTHRVTAVERRHGQTLIRTKGDANAAPDPWLARIDDTTVWRVHATVPLVGSVIRALHRPVAHVLALYLLPSVLLTWLLVGLWRRPDARHAR